MDRRNGDRDDRGREPWSGRDQWRHDQHEHDRSRYRQNDEYMHHHRHDGDRQAQWGDRQRRDEPRHDSREGSYGDRSWERGLRHGSDRPHDEQPLHGRYQYGPEEDERHMWGTPRPGDGEGYSRVGGGPRREAPYRSPSRSDEYGMYREGNHSGYDTWHGHNYFQSHNDAGAMGSAPINSWQRSEPRDERGRRGLSDERRGGLGSWREESGRREEYGRRDDGRRREELGRREDYGRREDESRRSEDGNRDISRTWRMFDSWGDTDYSDRRGQGLGYHRGDDYGDRFWSSNERSRDDR